jgi:acetylornithine deacetylase
MPLTGNQTVNTNLVKREKNLKLLQKLIQIESINPSLDPQGSGEKKIGQFLQKYLKKMGLKVEIQKVIADRSNIVGIKRGKGSGKNLILNGHMDTVGARGMTIDPFQGDHKNGQVFGRGSADMKSGITSILAACEVLQAEKIQLNGDLILAFVVDEEYKSRGTEKLLQEYSAQAAIVCEPTDLKIGLAHKGFIWGNVKIQGKASHGSRPDEGIDAITKAGQFLMEIEKLGQNHLLNKNHPLVGSPSVHASLIKGGRELSTYPDYCQIQLERRTIPDEDEDILKNELDNIIKQIQKKDPQFKAEADIIFQRPPLEISREEPIVEVLAQCYKKTLNKDAKYSGITWWMDSALFVQAGIPTVTFGPSGSGLHSAVEYVNFQSVLDCAIILADVATHFCET